MAKNRKRNGKPNGSKEGGAAVVVMFKKLDEMENIRPKFRADGRRRITVALPDEVSEQLNSMNTPSEIATWAVQFGITPEEILRRAEIAPNFGWFRMVIGNRVRGILRRLERNPQLTLEKAANAARLIDKTVGRR